jgi:hypothetical protein
MSLCLLYILFKGQVDALPPSGVIMRLMSTSNQPVGVCCKQRQNKQWQ